VGRKVFWICVFRFSIPSTSSTGRRSQRSQKVEKARCRAPDPVGTSSARRYYQLLSRRLREIEHTPDASVSASPDGKASGIWFFEKYGVDFAKEDGQWKIWHIQMFHDLTGPLEKGFADLPIGRTGPVEVAEDRTVKDPRNQPDNANPNPYKGWSPTTVPVMVRMPEPYNTFGETFSRICACSGKPRQVPSASKRNQGRS
jgi:hypothetical protein